MAVLVWKDTNKDEIEEFVKKDPYIQNGLVTKYRIRDWNVVIK